MDLRHHFLLSMPSLSESYFDKTLTYIYKHNDEGALGFIVNRPTSLLLGDVFEQLKFASNPTASHTMPVYEGGPVSPERGFLLYVDDNPLLPSPTDANSRNTDSKIVLSASLEMLDAIALGDGPDQFLLILGYAGWHTGQLESEIADNAWLTCEADADILFTPDPAVKFDLAARSLGIDFSLLSGEAGHA